VDNTLAARLVMYPLSFVAQTAAIWLNVTSSTEPEVRNVFD